MKKKLCVSLAIVLFFFVVPLYAQGGCVNSPENPTAILALVGSAGALLAAARGRFRK